MIAANNAHIKAITENGGKVLGAAPLFAEDRRIAEQVFDGAWGYGVIRVLAEHLDTHGELPAHTA